tara:strand:- start:2317 stop:3822 length:1506 start_codon:yes stop_codon:yes gene_type:complete
MQSTFVDFELQFRTLVKKTKSKNRGGSGAGKKSAYNSGIHRNRNKRKRHRSSSSPQLAEAGRSLLKSPEKKHTDFFADYGKPTIPQQRMGLGELEQKRLMIPYIDTLEFVRLNLERRGIHSREKESNSKKRKVSVESTQPETMVENFDMDLSEFDFLDPLSSCNIQRRRQQRQRQKLNRNQTKDQHQHQHQQEQHQPNETDHNNTTSFTNSTTTSSFNPVFYRRRFPIFTDFLGFATRVQVTKRPDAWLLQLIEEIYDAFYHYDCNQLVKQIALSKTNDGQNRPPPLNTPTFVYQHIEKQLGLKQLINPTAWDIMYNMEMAMKDEAQEEEKKEGDQESTTLGKKNTTATTNRPAGGRLMYPEMAMFQSFLRELITAEHVLFFLHCRHLVQTEHEITFATRDKINTTTCTPGRMMSVDPIGQTAGTCLLTNHPTISKTKNVWLSLKGTHAVTNTTKYHGHTFDKQHCFFNTHFLNTHMYFFPLVLFVQVHVKSSKRYCITMN